MGPAEILLLLEGDTGVGLPAKSHLIDDTDATQGLKIDDVTGDYLLTED